MGGGNGFVWRERCRAGLHNSESSKGQIDQHKLAAGRKSLFRHGVEEILKGQEIIRSRAFVTFSATEFSRAARKDLAGRMWPAGRMLCTPGVGTGAQLTPEQMCQRSYNF